MTIGIAIAVPDGIALAADTQTTWNRTIFKAKEKNSGKDIELADPIRLPIGWSRMARKMFSVEMKGTTYAVITAGMAHLNTKSMYAVIRSGAHNYQGDGSIDDVSQYLATYLKDELAKHLSCSVKDLSKQSLNVCELIIATYENNDVAKPVIESHLVFSGMLNFAGSLDNSGHIRNWSNRTTPNRYHGCWIGRKEFITHLVNHKNPELPPISGQFGMMTLADAVDYTRFLVEFTCDFQRFAVMVPDCGRPITSSTLTPEGYEEKVVG